MRPGCFYPGRLAALLPNRLGLLRRGCLRARRRRLRRDSGFSWSRGALRALGGLSLLGMALAMATAATSAAADR
ncbi:MAG: hypothetical protein M0015_03470, partial [Betaproteobacteria bacterium]|nr:hypothetical protein [Betaproteobacteria bacterium]